MGVVSLLDVEVFICPSWVPASHSSNNKIQSQISCSSEFSIIILSQVNLLTSLVKKKNPLANVFCYVQIRKQLWHKTKNVHLTRKNQFFKILLWVLRFSTQKDFSSERVLLKHAGRMRIDFWSNPTGSKDRKPRGRQVLHTLSHC